MSKNDDRILELKKKIELKKRDLAEKKIIFSPSTNCVLELDGVTYNLNVCTDGMLKLLMIKLNMYSISANDLGIDIPNVSGYSIDLWISDIRSKLEVSKMREEEKKLKENERLLEKLLSEDKKTEMMLDEISEMLK